MKASHFDVLILGGSFSGSVLAMLLARRGLSVVLIETGRHPRFAVGESSTPLADLLLRSFGTQYDLPLLCQMSTYGSWKQSLSSIVCGPKRGFAYQFHQPGKRFAAGEQHQFELLVSATSSLEVADLQWHRASVDEMLFQHAETQGVTCLSNVKGVASAESNRVSYSGTSGEHMLQLTADWGIDATSSACSPFVALSSLTKQPQERPYRTSTGALFGHVKGLKLWQQLLHKQRIHTREHPFPIDQSALHQVCQSGWFWQLRFDHDLTSLGMVIPNSQLRHIVSRQQAVAHFEHLLQSHPSLGQYFSSMQWSAPRDAPLWQPSLQRYREVNHGLRWFSLPMAIGFVDPLHSTGIAHSLWGIRQILTNLEDWSSLKSPDFPNAFSRQTQRELLHVDQFVSLCYEHLDNPHRFTLATLVYFAAATQSEAMLLSGQAVERSGFLLANVQEFSQLIPEYRTVLRSADLSDAQCWDHCAELLKPYDAVGLFTPEIPRMYSKTAAQ